MEADTRMAQREREDVLASAVAGDEIAFQHLIAMHHDDMRRVCAYVAGDLGLADEATQAAWVIAWKRLRDVREPDHLRPWLINVAANETKKLLRKQRTRARFEVATEASLEPGGRDPATGVSGLDLRDAISRLNADDRSLLALRYVAGFKLGAGSDGDAWCGGVVSFDGTTSMRSLDGLCTYDAGLASDGRLWLEAGESGGSHPHLRHHPRGRGGGCVGAGSDRRDLRRYRASSGVNGRGW